MAHSRLSPSSAERWLACPASVAASEPFADTTSAAAEEGTVAHEVVENLINAWLEGSIFEFSGISDEMVTHAKDALKWVQDTASHYDDAAVYTELKVDPHYYVGTHDCKGTADIIIDTPNHLYVVDYKYGSGIYVPVKDNPQLKLYALGAMANDVGKYDDVTCVVIQPRNRGTEDEAVRTHTYRAIDLEDWAINTVAPMVKETEKPVMYNPGTDQCRWCKAKPTCPAAAQKVLSCFEAVNTIEELPMLANTTPDTLSAAQLAGIVENEPFITGYLKAVNARVREMLENREDVPGLKLVRGRQRNVWAETDDIIIEQLSKGKGCIFKKDLLIPKLKSAPVLLKQKLTAPQKARLQAMIKKSEGALSIAHESDERPNAIAPLPFTASYDFL